MSQVPAGEAPAWQSATGMPPGEPSSLGFRIEQMGLVGSQLVKVPAGGVTAIVGANNSGKSTLLRQLHGQLINPHNLAGEPVRLLETVTSSRIGTESDLLAWLDVHATYRPAMPNEGHRGVFARPGGSVLLDSALQSWRGGPEQPLGELGPLLISYADAQSRLGYVGAVGQRGDVGEPPQHPLHLLQDDASLRERLSDLSLRIFGQPLTLDHLSGNMQLRVGVPSEPAPAADESQRPYRTALASLPLLAAQGDGMKSLLGLLIPIVTATYPVVIVDEPEAFLHPPQAHALGQALGQLALERGLQVILATHDRNLLAGLLSSSAPLSVVRVSRDGNATRARQLPAEQLHELWADPVLKYSNVLEGLFHRLVVLAEADRDCRFYEAALDAAAVRGQSPIPPSDVLFVPSYGKAAMHRLATVLEAVDVPVVATPDLDVLNDSATLQRLVEAVHGQWSDMADAYAVATDPFRQPREAVKISHVRDSLNRLFDDLTQSDADAPYVAEARDAALAELRSRESPWRALKLYGMRAFKGEAAAAAESLVSALDQAGVVVVREGELEGFAPALGLSKGPAWLAAAIETGAHAGDAAQAHVSRLLAHAGD